MKKIYTSYFRSPVAKSAITKAVSIARWSPRTWGDRPRYYPLAPLPSQLKRMRGLELNRCLKMYRDEVLDKLDPKQVLSELPDQAILCCYEDDPRYCHRSEVAKWFKRELGLKVEEIILWPDDISIT